MPLSDVVSAHWRQAPDWDSNPYQPHNARIIGIDTLIPDHRLFTLRFEDAALASGFRHRPGQFVMLSVPGAGEAPFSIASPPTRPGILELCVRRTGRVTDALFRLRLHQVVGVRGPYGNGYPVDVMEGGSLLISAAGLGIAPLRSLLWYALDERERFDRLILMYGARDPAHMLFHDELVALTDREDLECMLAVDTDPTGAWKGVLGHLPELFDDAEIDPATTHAAVCGPPVVYQFVLERLLDLGFAKDRILMSLFRRMKCGVGKCGHCSVGYKHTCLQGPVFTYWDAINLPEVI